MNRAELRRNKKDEAKHNKTFVLTQDQINELQKQAADKAIELMAERSFVLMMGLPLEILITEEYWKKSAKKRLPKFMDDVLTLYKAYQNGLISFEEIEADLWEFAGIRCENK